VNSDAHKKKALVTGSTGALGRAVAQRLAQDGFEVWLHHRGKTDVAAALLSEIEAAGGSGRLLQFDLNHSEEMAESLAPMLSAYGPLSVLVNNAGAASEGYMMMLPDHQWHTVLETNLGGFFRVTKACLKGMVQQRRGRIINISSLAGAKGTVGQVAYSASKAGIEGATRTLAVEMARWNILVNAVAPGPLEAGMASFDQHEKFIAEIPLGRLGRLSEVAGVVSFLASDDASYITGQVIAVNGGMGM
jgi:3-oxoacyl-[acyl-carrier protein] reductase